MKHLKLFFALFAMLALGVGNAWAQETHTIGWGSATGTNSTNFTATDGSGEVANVVSVTTAKNSASSAPAYNSSSKELRLYYNAQGNGCSLTLTPVEGITITGVKITASSSSYTPTVKYNVDGGSDASGTWSSTTMTINGINATTSLKLRNANTANKQLRIKTIQITYTKEVATGPTLSVTPNKVDFGTKNIYFESEKQGSLEIDITGQNLTGNVTATITEDDDNVFSLSSSSFAPNAGEVSEKLTVSYEVSEEKEYSATLTLSSDGVEAIELPITLTTVNKKPTVYTKVTDAATLSAGDKVIFVYESGKAAAGAFSSGYLTSIDIAQAINATADPATVSITDEAVVEYTLGGTTGAWELISASGKLSEASANSSGSVNLAFDKGTKWTISISSGDATIKGTTNTIKYNTSSPRFKTYSSGQTAIQLYSISVPKYAVTFTQPEGGELIVKNGETAITSGNTFAEGIKLTVTATPETGYEDGVVVVKNASDEDVTADVYEAGTLTMPAYAVTISATFEKKPCELLAKPTVSATTTYSSATLTWEAVANAAKYSVKVGETTTEVTEPTYTATGLNAETTYTYQVQAIAEAEQDTYCDSEVAEGSFTTAAAPVATLTLSDIEGTTTQTGALNGTITLPTTAAECSKTFVGWDADENCNHAPTYAPGAEYTLAAETQTLYAVYADGEAGETVNVFSETFDACEGKGANGDEAWSGTGIAAATLTLEGWTFEKGNAANGCAKFGTSSVKGSAETPAIALTGNAILTFRAGAWDGSSEKTTLNISAVGATLDMSSVTLKKAEWTTYTVAITNASGSVNVKFEAANASNNRFFLDDVVVSQTSVNYSNYSTTCAAALEEPTFSVAEGEYTEAKSIVLNATEGDIYYTLDGTEPTKLSIPYTDAIVLDECGEYTIKAIAISSDSESPVASATYTINLPITNTAATAYTPAEAIAIIDGACDKSEEVYVKGVVVSTSEFNATYGNYDVIVKAVDDNSATPTTFTFYRMYKAASNTKFTESDEVIGVGDIITAKGVLKKYNSTYELAEGCYMVERVAFTEPKTDISNTFETAYTVDKAFELISDVKSDLDKEVYVKGLVAVASTQLYEEKYLTYSISDNGQTTGNTLKVYDGLNIGGVAFASKDDVKVGDYVVVKGKLINYGGTYEINKDNQLVQHKKAATIEVADIAMEVGETQDIFATVTPEGASVSYAIKEGSDDCIDLNDAEITAKEAGTATIVATIAETADYMGAEKEFTVTVTAVDTRKKAVSPSPFAAVSGDMNPNDITYTSYQGGAGTAPAIHNDGIRLYQISSGNTYGGYITLKAVKGCMIDQVEITTTNQYNTTTVAYSVDGNETLLGSADVAKLSKYSTPVGLNSESVNILNLGSTSSNRLEIASITVYYTGQPLADPELSWTYNTVELRVGEAFTAPTLNNPYNVKGITYRSDNELLAKVNETTGAVTLVPDATGTATITAEFEGNDTYKAVAVSYTITVKHALVYGVWDLVTDHTTLAAGDKVIIVAKDDDYALSTTQNSNNRGRAAVTKNSDNNTVAFGKDVQVLTLETGTVDNTFALNTGNGYLYASSTSSNQLKTQAKKDDNASWNISIADGTATIVAQGTNTRNTMQYNQSSSLFACYASASQKALCLYMKKNVKVEGETDNASIPNQSDVTVDNAELNVTTEAEYDNMYIGNNGSVDVEETVTVNNLYIQTTMGTTTSGQLNTAPGNLIVNGDAFIDITLGKNGDPSQWHAFTVPFPVDAMNGIFDLNDNKLTNGVNYAIMQYHGDVRAQGKYGWKKYSGVLVPGTFYLMTVDGARTTYRFKKVKDEDLVAANTKSLVAYSGDGEDIDQGWNGVGNPTLMHGKVAFDAQILDPESYTYKTITASSAHFTVGTPFFIQAAADDVVTIASETNGSLAPARRAAAAVDKVKVMLGNADYTDYLYVSASEDATNEYEIGKDLAKMTMTNTPIVPQIFAQAYGTYLCMVNAPMISNEATVALNLYAPAEGEYTLSVEEQADATVYLLYNGNIVWNLSMGEYPIHLTQGNNAGYSLVVRRENAPTDVENIFGADEQTEKFIYNGNLYILHEGKVFDAVGNVLK